MAGFAQLCFLFPIDATFDEVTSAIARHFGGEPINLSTGQPDTPPLRDATAVFTGTSQMTVSTGTSAATSAPTRDVDAEGIPWDARIHSDSKAKTDDGKWRMRRGAATRADLAAIKAELLASVGGAPAAQAAQQTQSSTPPQDSEEFRKARIEYARGKAFSVAGPQQCDDDTFAKLTRGQLVTGVAPYVLDWFKAWQVAFNAAYGEYTAAPPAVHMSTQAINGDAPAGIAQLSGTAQQLAATLPPTTPAMVAMPGDPAPKPPVDKTFLGADASALSGNDFASFVGWQAMQANNGRLSAQQLQGVFAQLGIEHLGALAQQPAMIPAVKALLAAQGIV